MLKRVLFLVVGVVFLISCGSPPKTSRRYSYKRYAYHDRDADPANQDSIEDLIYSELSKRQQSLLKKYRVPTSSHSLGGVKFDIPVVVNERVSSWIDYFANGSGRQHYARYLSRSTRFVPLQLRILKEHHLPTDLIFLSMIESGFNTHAYSSAAASGLWQFIRSTGRLYDLDSDYWVDERRDPEKATLAAARHLRDLYEEFGDWYLAFAAYNAGAGKVRRAIEGVGSRNFWDLADSSYLRQETKDYVPKILAAAIIGKSPEKYGFRDVDFQDPIGIEKVTVTSPTDLEVIAECAGVDVDLIRLINPELLRNMTPPHRSNYVLSVPRGTKRSFETRYARLGPSERLRNVRYVAQSGDTLRSVAQDHGVTVASLMNANPSLGSRRSIPTGMALIVPRAYDSPPPVPFNSSYAASRGNRLIDLIASQSEKTKPEKGKKKKEKEKVITASREESEGEMKVAWSEKTGSEATAAVTSPENTSPTSVDSEEKKTADTSTEIATVPAPSGEQESGNVDNAIQKSLEKVQEEPAAEGSTEDPGIRIKTSGEEGTLARSTPKSSLKKKSETALFHQVKKGETLTGLAKRYKVTVAELKEWNRLTGKKGLQAHQKLIIRSVVAEAKIEPSSSKDKTVAVTKNEKGTKTKLAKKTPAKVIAYRVRKGDTLNKIAKKYDVPPSEIMGLNGLSKRSTLKPGLVLKIRAKQLAREG